MSNDEAMNLWKNADLTKISETLVKRKFNIIYKMPKEMITFREIEVW